MVRKRKSKSTKHPRTPLEIEEEQSRTLYIRLPKTIKSVDEIKPLFFGDFHVKLPRQSGRFCHVIFPSIEEKVKNLKKVKKKIVHGRPVFACDPRPINLEKKKKPKKIKIPDPEKEASERQYLFISNIPAGTKVPQIIEAFPGAVTVVLLKGLFKNGTRRAKLKISKILCQHYIKNKSQWPTINGKKVKVKLATKSKRKQNKESKTNSKDKSDENSDSEYQTASSNNGTDSESNDDDEEVEEDEEEEEEEEEDEGEEDEVESEEEEEESSHEE